MCNDAKKKKSGNRKFSAASRPPLSGCLRGEKDAEKKKKSSNPGAEHAGKLKRKGADQFHRRENEVHHARPKEIWCRRDEKKERAGAMIGPATRAEKGKSREASAPELREEGANV